MLQNVMQIRKPNIVSIQIPVTVTCLSPCGNVITPLLTLSS